MRRGRGSAAAARVRARPPRTWNAAKIEGLAACIKVTEANRARTKGDRRREPPGDLIPAANPGLGRYYSFAHEPLRVRRRRARDVLA